MSLMDTLKQSDPEIAKEIDLELNRQRTKLELIASENIVSKAVMEAQGSVLTNKYAEGYPGKRYYGGCEYVDVVEQLAIDRAKKLFGAAYANVQPHSGAQANMAVFFSLLTPGDTVMGMNLTDGGHLTHGSPVNMSGKYFKIVPYGVDKETERIDYDALEKQAEECKPKLIVAGASAYARIIDFPRLAEIAHKVGAYLMVDIAHIAGLVAAGLHPSPVPYADVVTTTTHKTMRGPRGGMILCKDAEFGKQFNKEGKEVCYGRKPLVAVGTTDMHSQTQQHQEGKLNKVVQFVKIENWANDLEIPNVFPEAKKLADISGVTMSEALEVARQSNADALASNKRYNACFALPELNAYHLGELLYMLAMSVAYEGELADVDAFNQPGVESYKRIMGPKLQSLKAAKAAK